MRQGRFVLMTDRLFDMAERAPHDHCSFVLAVVLFHMIIRALVLRLLYHRAAISLQKRYRPALTCDLLSAPAEVPEEEEEVAERRGAGHLHPALLAGPAHGPPDRSNGDRRGEDPAQLQGLPLEQPERQVPATLSTDLR